MKRNRGKQTVSLEDRIADEVRRLREKAELLPQGPRRDQAMRRVQQAETGLHMNEWLTSPGLQSQK